MRDLVIHAPTGIELDFAREDFGGPQQAAVIAEWAERAVRAPGRKSEQGEFICHVHRFHEKPWLYLQQRGRVIIAAHWPGSRLDGSHQIRHGVSDEHQRQVEYIARAGEGAGFTVETEVRLPTRARSDAVIYGPTTTGIEVQRSPLTVREAKARTTRARRAGVTPIWFSDAPRNPAWLFTVPSVRMNEQSWDSVPRVRSVTVASGIRTVKARLCRDIPGKPCKQWRSHRRVEIWHPIHEPQLGVTVDDLAELIPNGELVPISYRTLSGRDYTLIVGRKDKQLYESLTGRSGDLPLKPQSSRTRNDIRSACDAEAGGLIAATCCGRSLWPADEPVVPACQLCPKSPTYWRRSHTQEVS